MKKMFLLFLMISGAAILYGQPAGDGKMPITTKSDAARKLFYKAEREYREVRFEACANLLMEAKNEDPGFFMADALLALTYLAGGDIPGFKEYATAAINNKSKINSGEEVYKESLKKLLENQSADLSEQAGKLIALYPKDQTGYVMFALSSLNKEDYQAALTNLKKAMDIADYKPSIYNLMGYSYMGLNMMDEAKKAFEKYIELAPDVANAYDSMGDYYFAMKEYRKANDNFSKAAGMGLDFSAPKAEKSRHLADSLGMK